MTERLYYTDAYLSDFRARVLDQSDGGRRVYLEQSAFYPTSGGQLHDLGTLAGVTVVDVVDEDSRVAHILAEPLASGISEVAATIDWARRFDFMQQHTGQHLLSALFEDRYKWPTVSVHFGTESATLDVTAPNFDVSQLADAEIIANALVAENREVSVSFEDAATAQGLRKPSDRVGALRIVSIDGLDRSACGGTHVRHTGEIGAIFLRRAEKTKGQVRIEFLCGQRAVRAARHDAVLLARTAGVFNASVDDVPRLVEAQQQQLKDADREVRRLRAELATFEARGLWDHATADANGVKRIAISLDSGAVKEQEALAQAVVLLGHAAIVITSQSPVGVMLATSGDSGIDAGQTMRSAISPMGGRGGGSPRLAQASLPDASHLTAVVRALGFTA
jgi:alanyl-tRNA synthetase